MLPFSGAVPSASEDRDRCNGLFGSDESRPLLDDSRGGPNRWKEKFFAGAVEGL
jgi:hypothetical protein